MFDQQKTDNTATVVGICITMNKSKLKWISICLYLPNRTICVGVRRDNSMMQVHHVMWHVGHLSSNNHVNRLRNALSWTWAILAASRNWPGYFPHSAECLGLIKDSWWTCAASRLLRKPSGEKTHFEFPVPKPISARLLLQQQQLDPPPRLPPPRQLKARNQSLLLF
jgi:hypothetical protein